MQRDVDFDRSPSMLQKHALSTQGAELFQATVVQLQCSFEFSPLFHLANSTVISSQKLRICSRVRFAVTAVWARMRPRDRSATSWAYSRITAVERMSSLGSGPRCGAPKWAGSGSHDLTAGELENWNRSALTGGVQTMHGQ